MCRFHTNAGLACYLTLANGGSNTQVGQGYRIRADIAFANRQASPITRRNERDGDAKLITTFP